MPGTKVKLGFLPTRRIGVFDSEIAVQQKKEIETKLRVLGLSFVDIDFLNDEGLIFQQKDADAVVKHFNDNKVDAVIAVFCNFGCEEAVMKVAKFTGKPVLLWGPRDPAPLPDKTRVTDSQCGLFAASKVLRQAGLTFTYLENCAMDTAVFEDGIKQFISTVSIVKSMTRLRLGQIGVRPDLFHSVKFNELELFERFGIEVVPITLNHLTRMFKDIYENKKDAVAAEVNNFLQSFDYKFDRSWLEKSAALKLSIKRWMDDENLTAAAAYCWGVMGDSVGGITPCFAFSELTDLHYPVICETDVMGAVSSVILQAAAQWEKASFLADLTMRHPTNDNAELFWHCGVFPKSTARNDRRPVIGEQFNRHVPAVCELELAPGTITIARFDSDHGQYRLLTARGRTVEGPATTGAYGWLEFKNWPALEKKLMYGPYIHHIAGIYGEYTASIEEAIRYLPGITVEKE
jgi:L-fucose isomerase-like protein